MKKVGHAALLLFLVDLSASLFSFSTHAEAVNTGASSLHVVKSSVNADSENPEFCLEFDQPLADKQPARLTDAIHLDDGGKPAPPRHIDINGASLCLFPLQHGHSYRVTVNNLISASNAALAAPFRQSFSVADRSSQLRFNGSGFGSYDEGLTLRTVNIDHLSLTIYRLSDPVAMARAWQDRAQTLLAPSESAYMAKDKGQQVWQQNLPLTSSPDGPPARNIAAENKLALAHLAPDLAPGLYLALAEAPQPDAKPASKGLAPLAATWFVRSDFSIRALRDNDGVHVIASDNDNLRPKTNIHLRAMDNRPVQLAETQTDAASGVGLMAAAPGLPAADSIVATDAAGNVAFADITSPPALEDLPRPGSLSMAAPFALPGETVDLVLQAAAEKGPQTASILRLSRGQTPYAFFPVSPLKAGQTTLSFPAPAVQGAWALSWQKGDGATLGNDSLRITGLPDAPHLTASVDRAALNRDAAWPVTIQSLTSNGAAAPLIAGKVVVAWQRQEPTAAAWKDYKFGAPVTEEPENRSFDFITDLQGRATVKAVLPKPPGDGGIYRAAVRAGAGDHSGIADAPVLLLPVQSDLLAVGIRPLAPEARFEQNSMARFAVIGLSLDGAPHDLNGLTYQISEEGRSFAWYQDAGYWNYKPEAQLRVVGGGALAIKADGSTVLEWPVTAGNYRLEIFDAANKSLARVSFSAEWQQRGTPALPIAPLEMTAPARAQPGHEVAVHFTLPRAALVTAVIADHTIRQIIHEARPQGDNILAFAPQDDWRDGVSISVDAVFAGGQTDALHGQRQIALAAATSPPDQPPPGPALIPVENTAVEPLVNGQTASYTLALQNRGDDRETFHYAFTVSPGLRILHGDKGVTTIAARQSVGLTVVVDAETPGEKALKGEIKGSHGSRLVRSWPVMVGLANSYFRSLHTDMLAARQAMAVVTPAMREAKFIFIGRRSMDGLPEILAALYHAQPFTTSELALSIDALRLWGDTMTQSGMAPNSVLAAKRGAWIQRLLERQNADGGFPSWQGDSTWEDTAAVLIALGPDHSVATAGAKNLAIGWIKQRLANTWFDQKERNGRAAAYAGLAAADSLDPASLRYFSDVSANGPVDPTACAHIAAAFKHISDFDAASFWIGKLLAAPKPTDTVPLLNALAATDALSSDDVQTAMDQMVRQLRQNSKVPPERIAEMLRAVATDNADAGLWRIETGGQTRQIAGVAALRLPMTAPPRNVNALPLFITLAGEAPPPPGAAGLSRHIYKLNGVEVPATRKLATGEIYAVELRGNLPENGPESFLVDDSSPALRPIECALSATAEIPASLQWVNQHRLTPVLWCESKPHAIDMVAANGSLAGRHSFTFMYFAFIDAATAAALPPASMRAIAK